MKIKQMFVVLFILCVFTGCVTTADFSRSQYELRKKVDAVEKLLETTRGDIDVKIGNLQQNQADKDVEIVALKNRLRELQGLISEIRNEIHLYRDLKTKVDLIGDKINQINNRLSVMENNALSSKSSTDVVLSKDGNATHEIMNNDKIKTEASSLFKGAYALFKQRKFDRARFDFANLLKRFPGSDYAANAQFWIAESLFLEKEYEKAILEYEKVIKVYPTNEKVCNALLKQGLSFVKLGDKQSAKLIFKQVIKAFPNSSQAKSAQTNLNDLK